MTDAEPVQAYVPDAGLTPVMPVEDRAADTWEPLVAVADLAGGAWPEAARAAYRAPKRLRER